MLLTVQECTELTGRSLKTIKRRLYGPGVYTELHFVRRQGRLGAVRTLFVDPKTLQLQDVPSHLRGSHNSQKVSEGHSRRVKIVSEGHKQDTATLTSKTPKSVNLTEVSEGHVSEGHLARINIHPGSRKTRSDKGSYRHTPEQHQLAVYAIVKNPTASIRMLHRWLVRACGFELSASKLRKIEKDLKKDPHTRLMFLNADTRKEFLRTYAGQVFAPYANAMWQLDMTRCDILVWDEDLGRVIRPRVHAIIDVHSGCYASLVFSVREDQSQTDAAITGGLVAKTGKYEAAWPVFGTPEVLYMDNGKTYRSEHVHRYLSELGVEVIHSRPLVSHTRGKVERGFGTLHGYEKLHPGYCGANAKERNTFELRRLTKRTLTWVERGMTPETDPGRNERLLTLTEFRHFMLEMVIADYHDTVVDGKSRLQHFLETVPPKTQRLYSQRDLMLVLARRTTRTVNPDGSVRFGNRFWTVESGELAPLRGLEVLVLSNPATPDVPYYFAWEPSRGGLELIGEAVLMPERSDSDEARALRANSRAAKKRELQHQTQQKQLMDNGHLSLLNLVSEHAQAELNTPALPPVQRPQARLEAVSGPQGEPDDLDDDLTRFLLEGTPYEPGASIDDYFDASKANWKKKGNQ